MRYMYSFGLAIAGNNLRGQEEGPAGSNELERQHICDAL